MGRPKKQEEELVFEEDESEDESKDESEDEPKEEIEEAKTYPIESYEETDISEEKPKAKAQKVVLKEIKKIIPEKSFEESREWLLEEEKRIKAKLEEIKKKESFDNFIKDAPKLIEDILDKMKIFDEKINKLESNFKLLINSR